MGSVNAPSSSRKSGSVSSLDPADGDRPPGEASCSADGSLDKAFTEALAPGDRSAPESQSTTCSVHRDHVVCRMTPRQALTIRCSGQKARAVEAPMAHTHTHTHTHTHNASIIRKITFSKGSGQKLDCRS